MEITLRFAERKDSLDILAWRNDPVTVRFSPTGTVKLEDHLKWFEDKLSSLNTNIFIALQEQNKIGMIRFDREGRSAEVSINLNPDYRGKGYGKKCLEQAVYLYFTNFPVYELTARIMPENAASINIFTKIGFKQNERESKEATKMLYFSLQKDYFLSLIPEQ